MDEPKYTRLQVENAIHKAERALTINPCICHMVLAALDPPKRTCRCGKWTWDVEQNVWEDGLMKLAPRLRINNFIGCSSCRCALLEKGEVSEPLADRDEYRQAGQRESMTTFYTFLRDRPISAAPSQS